MPSRFQLLSPRVSSIVDLISVRRSWWLPAAFSIGPLLLLLSACTTEQEATVEDYRAQYDKPLLSAGTQFAALPPAVQNTIRAEVGSSDIADIVKDTNLGHVIYRVSFENSDLFPRLNIAADGSLLDP